MEVGENGRILEAVGLSGPSKLPALSLSLTFVLGSLGSVTGSEELTSKKTHKIAKYLPKEKR